MKKITLLLTVFLFTFSCGTYDWNAENKKAFIDACNADGTMRAYCECYLNQMIKEDISLIDSSMLTEDEVVEIAEKCYDKL